MDNLERKMQEIGLNSEGMVNAVNMERDQFLVRTLVQNPMDSFRRKIGKIISNDRNQELRELHESLKVLFREVDDLVTLPFNNLDLLIAEVKEKLENFLEVENALNDN